MNMKRTFLFLFLSVLAMTLIACGGSEPTATPLPSPTDEPPTEAPPEATATTEVDVAPEEVAAPEPVIGTAVVDSVLIDPQSNTATVAGNLPDGCTEIYESSQSVDGNTISIELSTTRPADMMCTSVLSPYTEEIVVDTAGLEDGEYTVEVNGIASEQPLIVGDVSTEITSADLININWQWADLIETEPAAQSAVPTPEKYTITFFENNTLFIKADCNNISGTYTLEGNLLTMEMGPTTQVFCGETSLDQQYIALLSSVVGAEGENGRLILITSENARMGFNNGGTADAPSEEEDAPIETVADAYGKTWQWTQFSDTVEGSQEIAEPERYELILNEDGTIDVKADCNQVSGTYTLEDSSIAITFGPATAAACPEDSLADEYIQNLSAAAIVFFQDGSMYFDTVADSGTMKLDLADKTTTTEAAGAEIVETIWQWASFTDPVNGPQDIGDPSRYQIELQTEDTILIQADCNNGSGSYSIEGQNIAIVPGPLTRAACPEDSQADDFLKNLEASAIWFMQDGDLFFDLKFDSGTMRFVAADDVTLGEETPVSAIDEEETTEALEGETVQISLQGLADSFEWAVQPGFPPSTGPAGFGMSPHILVTFDGEDPADVLAENGRRLYIFPNEAYQTVAGDPVINQVARLQELIEVGFGSDPMPLLPPPSSFMDRWAQYLPVDFTQGAGVRYVSDSPARQQIGVWSNDVTAYYYQGLTEDGRFYLSLIWPVSTEALPATADDAPEDVKATATNPDTYDAYKEATQETLNNLSSAEFDPQLDKLDALVASIQLQN